MTVLSNDKATVIFNKKGIGRWSADFKEAAAMNKGDFKSKYSSSLKGYVDTVYDDLQAIKKAEGITSKKSKADKDAD